MEEMKQNAKPLNSKNAHKTGAETETMVPASQIQGVLQQTEVRLRQMAEQLKQMNQMLTDKTIDQLFNVVKHSSYFEADFVNKCTDCIARYISSVAFEPETKEEAVSEKAEPDKEEA